MIELDTTSLFVRPDDAAGNRDTLGKSDAQFFAQVRSQAGAKHHAVVRNVTHPPQTMILITLDMGHLENRMDAKIIAALPSTPGFVLLLRAVVPGSVG